MRSGRSGAGAPRVGDVTALLRRHSPWTGRRKIGPASSAPHGPANVDSQTTSATARFVGAVGVPGAGLAVGGLLRLAAPGRCPSALGAGHPGGLPTGCARRLAYVARSPMPATHRLLLVTLISRSDLLAAHRARGTVPANSSCAALGRAMPRCEPRISSSTPRLADKRIRVPLQHTLHS